MSFSSGCRCLLLGLLWISPSATPDGFAGDEIRVFAAASLTEVVTEIASNFERERGTSVLPVFAGAGTLARQISEGARAGIFISADEQRMDFLCERDLVLEGTRRPFATNSLVVIVPSDSSFKELPPRELAAPSIRRIAVGDAASVPVGAYAKEYLDGLGLWKALEKKIVPCVSARGVLAAVQSGGVDAGIVYGTDARLSSGVKVAHVVSESEGPRILYPAAVLKETRNPEDALQFLDYLFSKDSRAVLEKFGFVPVFKD